MFEPVKPDDVYELIVFVTEIYYRTPMYVCMNKVYNPEADAQARRYTLLNIICTLIP
jgi:hypothetical protein